jgi:hypothetical protein
MSKTKMYERTHDYFLGDCECNTEECQQPETCLALSCDECEKAIVDGEIFYLVLDGGETLCFTCAEKENFEY